MAFALYQPTFLPPSAVVVPQRIYGGYDEQASFSHIMFYDNGVPGVSVYRILSGTHHMNGANEIINLTEASRITLRVNVSARARHETQYTHALL